MKQASETIKLRRLEAELAKEKQLRLSAVQKLGGVQSLNTRLKAALVASRAEVAKLKGERQSVA
jgi:hypothetical protein